MLIFRTQTLVSNVTKKTILQSSDIAEPFDLNFKQKKTTTLFYSKRIVLFLEELNSIDHKEVQTCEQINCYFNNRFILGS